MRVLTACTLRELRANPVRTAVTVLGIALACALVLAVLTSALSLYGYIVGCERLQNGSENAWGSGLSASTAAGLDGAEGLAQVVVAREEGTAELAKAGEGDGAAAEKTAASSSDVLLADVELHAVAPDVSAGVADAASGMDAFAQITQTGVVEGRLPQAANELALPATGAAAAGLALGDAVELAFTDGTTQTFTLVGTVELASGAWYAGADAPVVALTCLDASNVPALAALAGDGSLWHAWVCADDPLWAFDILVRAAADDADALVSENSYLNRLVTFDPSTGVSLTLAAYALVLSAVVGAAGVLFVRNAFAIAVTERTRQFGLLSTVGATARQLRGMVLREAALLCVVGVPVGLAVGYAGTVAVLALCQNLVDTWAAVSWGRVPEGGLAATFSPAAFALAAVLAVLTALVAAWGPARRAAGLGAMAAVRAEGSLSLPRGVRRAGRVWGRLFGIEGELAAKSFCREARPRRAAVASLVCAVALVATASLFGSYTHELFSARGGLTHTYDVAYHFYPGVQDTPVAGEDDEDTAALLAQVPGAEQGMYGLWLWAEADLGGEWASAVALRFVDEDSWQELLDENGIDAAELAGQDGAAPRAVAAGTVNTVVDGRYATEAAFAPADLPAQVQATIEVYDGQVEASEVLSFDCTVGALISNEVWWLGSVEMPTLVYPLSALDDVLAGTDLQVVRDRCYWMVRVMGPDPVEIEDELVRELDERGLSTTRLYNAAVSDRSARALAATVQVFVTAFAAVVSLIAAAGAFNTMHSALARRRREFAVLRSAGLSRRGLAKLVGCECLLYLVRVLAWSVPAGLAVSGALWAATGASVYGAAFQLPWAVLPASAAVGLVMALAAVYALRATRADDSPVAALRAAGV
jgi:putative ABC transport system permease protein